MTDSLFQSNSQDATLSIHTQTLASPSTVSASSIAFFKLLTAARKFCTYAVIPMTPSLSREGSTSYDPMFTVGTGGCMPVPDREWLLSRRPMCEVEVDLDTTRGLVGGGRFEACTGESVPREDLRGLPCMMGVYSGTF